MIDFRDLVHVEDGVCCRRNCLRTHGPISPIRAVYRSTPASKLTSQRHSHLLPTRSRGSKAGVCTIRSDFARIKIISRLRASFAFCSFAAFGAPAARREPQRVRARRYLRSPKLPGIPVRSLHSCSAMKVCAELCAQRHTAATSALLRAASRCISVYENPGISRSSTSLQISPRCSRCCFAPYVLHSEKFRAFRPRFTSDTTSHDAGATWLYHGQTVRLE